MGLNDNKMGGVTPTIRQSVRISDCGLIFLSGNNKSVELKEATATLDELAPTPVLDFTDDQLLPWEEDILKQFVAEQSVHQAVVIGDMLEPRYVLLSLHLLEAGFHVFCIDTELQQESPERFTNLQRLTQAGGTPLTLQQFHVEVLI